MPTKRPWHRSHTHLLTMLIMLLVGMTSLTACNTLEGAGQDAENAGDAVKDAVD